MRTNRDQLVMMAVNGQIDHPRMGRFYVGHDGKGRLPVGTGGIVYNYAIGDRCMGIPGDHVEPGISIANPSDRENHALETLACIGNKAIVLNGPAAGKEGLVTGTHGGIEHTMLYFEREVLDMMQGDERFLIKTIGQGIKCLDYPSLFLTNLDPDLLDVIPIEEKDKQIHFPVVTVVPAQLMGSGLGVQTMMEGDYDIMTQDEQANALYHINDLRFGDFVAVQDHDATYGPHYKQGAVTIGVVVHSDSYTSGHGPGLTVVATTPTDCIVPLIDPKANLKHYFEQMKR